jgi:hypothetical protein
MSGFCANYGAAKQLKLSAGTSFDGGDVDVIHLKSFWSLYKGIITVVKGAIHPVITGWIHIFVIKFYQVFNACDIQNVYGIDDFFTWNKKTVTVEVRKSRGQRMFSDGVY